MRDTSQPISVGSVNFDLEVLSLLPHTDPATGLLPLGAHGATLEEVRERFVDGAPFEVARRRLVFDALGIYFETLRTFFPSGLALVDGGFVTHKVEPPHDVDVALFPDDPLLALSWDDQQFADFQGILTLQDVIIGGQSAAYFRRVQPFGGLLDSFIAPPEREQYWRESWSSIVGPGGLIPNSKGYLEVRW